MLQTGSLFPPPFSRPSRFSSPPPHYFRPLQVGLGNQQKTEKGPVSPDRLWGIATPWLAFALSTFRGALEVSCRDLPHTLFLGWGDPLRTVLRSQDTPPPYTHPHCGRCFTLAEPPGTVSLQVKELPGSGGRRSAACTSPPETRSLGLSHVCPLAAASRNQGAHVCVEADAPSPAQVRPSLALSVAPEEPAEPAWSRPTDTGRQPVCVILNHYVCGNSSGSS